MPVAGADRLALTRHIAVLDLDRARPRLAAAGGRPDARGRAEVAAGRPRRGGPHGLARRTQRQPRRGAGGARRADRPRLAAAQEQAGRAGASWRARSRALRLLRRRARPRAAAGGPCSPGSAPRPATPWTSSCASRSITSSAACPSLSLFLAAIESADIMIQRDMDAGRDEVRVMTVHGAKGLEAPVVFLADTCTVPAQQGRTASWCRWRTAWAGACLVAVQEARSRRGRGCSPARAGCHRRRVSPPALCGA